MKNCRILFITEVYPSGFSGSSVKSRTTIQVLLDRKNQVDVLTSTAPVERTATLTHDLLRVFSVQNEKIKRFSYFWWQKKFQLFHILLKPFEVASLYSAKFQSMLKLLEETTVYDFVIFGEFSVLQYIKIKKDHYIYLDDEDITEVLFKRYQQENNYINKIQKYCNYRLSYLFEQRYFPKLKYIWTINSEIKKKLSKSADAQLAVIPLIVPAHQSVFHRRSTDIVFSGTLNWEENSYGLTWFLDQVWPEVHAQKPTTMFYITGHGADEQLIQKMKAALNVKYLGFVDDLQTVYAKSAVAVSPVFINAGIKVKILTYLSYGIPTIGLKQSTIGMMSLDGVVVTPEKKFASTVIDLLDNDILRAQLSTKGLLNIQKHHSKQTLNHFFDQFKSKIS